LRAVGAAIAGKPDPNLLKFDYAAFDWQALCDEGERNRLLVLADRGFQLSGVSRSPEFEQRLQARSLSVSMLNGACLSAIRKVAPHFERAKIRAVFFKGPLSQHRLFGSYFLKLSTDVDILVTQKDFARSRMLCEDIGWKTARECTSLWWRYFLGEQHLTNGNAKNITIDLHHRTQQPGCPAPRVPDQLIACAEPVEVGGISVLTLSRPYACLLSCISLAKALIHREPCGGHAVDVSAFLARANEQEIRIVDELAGLQGLRKTLELGARTARVLFNVNSSMPTNQGIVLPSLNDELLMEAVLAPDLMGWAWPRRSIILWELLDDKRDFGSEMGWKFSSEACRWLELLAS
jgi:hypothetical protein